MNAGVGGHKLRHRYEALRRVALGESAGVGQSRGWVLLVRRGLAAWMRAWLKVTPTPAKTVRQETVTVHGILPIVSGIRQMADPKFLDVVLRDC